jgi:hypothetical protein
MSKCKRRWMVEAGSFILSATSLRLASPSVSARTRSKRAMRATVPEDVVLSVDRFVVMGYAR